MDAETRLPQDAEKVPSHEKKEFTLDVERMRFLMEQHMDLIAKHCQDKYSVDEIVNSIAGVVLNIFVGLPPQLRSKLELYDLFCDVTRNDLIKAVEDQAMEAVNADSNS